MSTITALNPAVVSTSSSNIAVVQPARSAAAKLEALNTRYPTLEGDIAQAKEDVAASAGSDTWAGLSKLEKAVFFIPPFGPLLGVMMLQMNKESIQKAERDLAQLESVAELKASLEQEVAASRPDRFGR